MVHWCLENDTDTLTSPDSVCALQSSKSQKVANPALQISDDLKLAHSSEMTLISHKWMGHNLLNIKDTINLQSIHSLQPIKQKYFLHTLM